MRISLELRFYAFFANFYKNIATKRFALKVAEKPPKGKNLKSLACVPPFYAVEETKQVAAEIFEIMGNLGSNFDKIES